MAVRRPRPPRRGRAPRQAGDYRTTVGAAGGGRLAEAAEEIADGARRNAAWSRQISGGIEVEVGENAAEIYSDAPPAYPAETQARHPLFGLTGRADDIRLRRGRVLGEGEKLKGHWYDPSEKQKPFLRPAVDQRAGPAAEKYAQVVDDMCRARGFSEDRV